VKLLYAIASTLFCVAAPAAASAQSLDYVGAVFRRLL